MATRPPATPRPPAGPRGPGQRRGANAARARVAALRAAGASYRAIGQATGLAPMTIRAVALERTWPQQATVTAILDLPPGPPTAGRSDAGGTRLRLRALHVMGHGSARIARAASASPPLIRAIVRGDAQTVTPGLRDAVTAVYDAWWDKQPLQATRGQKAAATAARRRAITGNWCPPAALDDDDLDTPGYQPDHGWRPARGTGTAPDHIPIAPARKRSPSR
jgi:lambda repressor-like predicted transcriptional regulator